MKATYSDNSEPAKPLTSYDLKPGQIGITIYGGMIVCAYQGHRFWLNSYDGGDAVPSLNTIRVPLAKILPVGSTVTLTVQS